MAALIETIAIAGRRAGIRCIKKHTLKTDMTPMVDLGFLLIAFFVITTELSNPVVTILNMPHEGPPIKLGDSNALTVLLSGDNNIYYYHGNMDDAISNNNIVQTTFSVKDGIGKIIRDKQQWLDKANVSDEKRDGLMLLIKATVNANYENMMAALDEALINNVKKYALVKTEPEEMRWLETHR